MAAPALSATPKAAAEMMDFLSGIVTLTDWVANY